MSKRKNSQWNKNLKIVHPEEYKKIKSIKPGSLSNKAKNALVILALKLGFKQHEKKVKPWSNKKEMKAYKWERKKYFQTRSENA